MRLEAAEKLGVERAQAALDHVRRARRLTLECLQDVRGSVAAMRAATLEELALEPSLRRLVSEFAESTGLRVRLEARVPENASLAPELAQALYRGVQEGLTNVQRHAQATEVMVILAFASCCVVLEIRDNGACAALRANGHQPDSSGYGLIGLRERVALLDGQLTFTPSTGSGSCLRLSLPMRGRRSSGRSDQVGA